MTQHADPADQPTDVIEPEGAQGAPDAPAAEGNGAAPAAAGSLLEQLVDRRREIAENVTADFELPNNAGALWGTFKLLPWKQVRKMAELAVGPRGRGGAELEAACDLIAAACDGLWLRDPASGERVEWPGWAEGAPLRFQADLLDYLRIDQPQHATPRNVIRLVLQRDLAVTSFQQELLRWMEGEHRSADEEFAGG